MAIADMRKMQLKESPKIFNKDTATESMLNADLISKQSVINSIANTNFWLSAENWQELMKAIDSVPSVQPWFGLKEKQKNFRKEVMRMTKLEAFMEKDPSVAPRIMEAICAGGWCTHCPGNTVRESCMFADTHWSDEEMIRYMLREEVPVDE